MFQKYNLIVIFEHQFSVFLRQYLIYQLQMAEGTQLRNYNIA